MPLLSIHTLSTKEGQSLAGAVHAKQCWTLLGFARLQHKADAYGHAEATIRHTTPYGITQHTI